MTRAAPTHGHVFAIIPVGTLEGAKSRLGETLDAEERRDLATRMAHRTIEAAVATPGIDEVLVVTPDQAVRDLAPAGAHRDGGGRVGRRGTPAAAAQPGPQPRPPRGA